MSDRTLKVAICIPSGDEWKADFGMSLAALMRYCAEHPLESGDRAEVRLFNIRTSILPLSRNWLFREALSWSADWVLCLDSDMSFPQNTLHMLLDAKRDVVAVNYMARRALNSHLLLTQLKDTKNFIVPGIAQRGGRGLRLWHSRWIEVDWTGFGVFLVSAAALRKVGSPWTGYRVEPDPGSDYVSEDHYFCDKLRENGYTVTVDVRLSALVRHVGACRFGFGEMEITDAVQRTP